MIKPVAKIAFVHVHESARDPEMEAKFVMDATETLRSATNIRVQKQLTENG